MRRALMVALAALLSVATARAETPDEELFRAGNQALQGGRPAEAIASFEALAERDQRDPALSFNRGLAYAARVAIDRGEPGDVGQAVAAFEEARALTEDRALASDAAVAATALRNLVAKRVARTGGSVVTPATPVSLGIAQALGDNGWPLVAIFSGVLLAASLLLRGRGESRGRYATGASLGLLVALPLLAAGLAFSYIERAYRLGGNDAVVIRERIELRGERGKMETIHEGAKLRIVGDSGDRLRVTYGELEGEVDRTALRRLAAPY